MEVISPPLSHTLSMQGLSSVGVRAYRWGGIGGTFRADNLALRSATSGDVRRRLRGASEQEKEAMVFQVRKWGWKRLASKLLLIPVLTGGAATVAHAQSGSNSAPSMGAPTSSATAPQGPMGGLPDDPQAILKEARKALAAGQFERALDLSHAAEAANKSGRWGLFEDTPNSLRKDIESSYAKAKKAHCEQLTKQAKALFVKTAANDAERSANLDQALQMAQRADQLHAPYSVWDMGDRPDKLVKEIQTARSSLHPGGTTPPVTPSTNGQYSSTFQPSPSTPAGAMAAHTPPMDAKKAMAMQLMGEAKKLADQGAFGPAKAKLIEADRIGAAFNANEYTPGYALQELNSRGLTAINRLVDEAKSQMAKKDFAKSDAALNGANDVATALGLSARPIDETRNQLRNVSSGKFGGPSSSVAVGAVKTEMQVPSVPGMATVTPQAKPGIALVADSKPVLPGGASPQQLLNQAYVEFKNGDMDLAAQLAKQAHNAGAQDEARRLLNTIDAERLKLKTIETKRSLDNAQISFKNRDYSHALGVLMLIDPMLLTAEQKTQRDELLAACQIEVKKDTVASASGVGVAGGPQMIEPPTLLPGVGGGQAIPGNNPQGSAQLVIDPKASADNMSNQVDALRRTQFQRLRTDGNKIQADATAAFGRGEPDLAIQMLLDYSARVRAANLEPSSVALLLRPIDSRLEMFRVMRGNQISIARLEKDNKDAKDSIARDSGAAEEQRKDEIKKLFAKYHELAKSGKYSEAVKVALQAKQLDPDNPACAALVTMAKLQEGVKDAEKLKDEKEEFFRKGLNAAEREGALVDVDDPIKMNLERMRLARGRKSGDFAYVHSYTPETYQIELKLNKPVQIDFSNTPLDQAVENLKTLIDIPLVIDRASLEAEGISWVKPVTVTPGHQIAAKHMLAFTLEQAGLSFVIEHDMVKVTTIKKAKGRLYTKVFSVADLVTPVPNFALPEYANFEKMMRAGTRDYGQRQSLINPGSAPFMPASGMNGGQAVGSLVGTGVASPSSGGQGGTLQTNQFENNKSNPLGWSVNLARDNNTKHEQLIKLITGMVRPYTWDGVGGPGRVEFYDIGSALVVNQTADVIQEVADLLEALRRLQDLAMSVELRIVSLSESWYERMGVDFSVNILTNSTKLQPQLTTVDPNTGAAGVFAPLPFINSIGNVGTTVGLTPAGTFTPDLNVPIQNSSFAMAIPPFGGYPNTPGSDGGVSLGLAFLNDIQVYLFMEAAAGDRRVNVMQAPKLTLFNGQTASISVSNTQFFVTSVEVISVNGQIVFSPIATAFPGPGDPANGTFSTLSVTIQGVVSADRRFVRLNLPVQMSAQTGTTVPLFPITTFVTPVFEGGSQGQPIPFTQFLQQPAFTDLSINTTVVCPDGGTVLLGGFKQLSEGRNEFGPPFLSDIPYLNRLFKNVGIGRETTHIMIMVTPRIIINSEEEIIQTEGRPQS
jgi:Flp pilus assembly secretin CpaC/tetratricopeptide (TPR) repeat protein